MSLLPVKMPGKKVGRKLPGRADRMQSMQSQSAGQIHSYAQAMDGKKPHPSLLGALGGMLQSGMMKKRQRKGAV